ncbi:TetR family transcriptional regulator [Kribbella sp. VKM Ac-2571]|uniref:TetR/AcrR family transcriptional regulator n=1 Tax=Kribbella sp. VKM Ac-2571 TaxID=2512222 RepID=UPI0010F39631|nr:TetR/AcrR family transcriptional regulator [Kribbella sp. VKM Ac-2571]TDO68994.1 TetR family transcriptional regulator [Kribbella sp. VKM Ac-2571]
MSETAEESGRVRQRRRTRAAIVDAAAELLRQGRSAPGINEIADAADVSRRTIYQYFPTLDQLLLDATLGLLTQTDVDAAIDSAAEHADATERVEAMIRALGDAAASSLPLGRSLIRLTVDLAEDAEQPKRGYRRIAWIERAIEPLRADLDEDLFEQLVSGIAMVVGWEALIVLQDLRGLDADSQVQASTWAARALIRAAVDEQASRYAAP